LILFHDYRITGPVHVRREDENGKPKSQLRVPGQNVWGLADRGRGG